LKQLMAFYAYIAEQFKPTADRLELEKLHGYTSFDLLRYLFKPKQHVMGFDKCSGVPYAFEITSGEYETDCRTKYFYIRGFRYEWSGTSWIQDWVSIQIDEYEGTELLSKLPCQHLTEERKEKLTQRGKLYHDLAGVHYKTYRGDRIVVDCQGYQEQGGYDRDPDFKIPPFESANLHLLPWRIQGFELASKCWRSFNVEEIKDVVFDDKAWDHLVLDDEVKILIKGLVEVTKNENTKKSLINDVISGKGGGLIAVLHGPPGTGKTLTAEAVAETLQRPLYMIGSSDLGTRANHMEGALKNVLKLASAWDAVLLIDEADVFLEQRSLHDLERNALVSVALKALEYHRGVLFLTTNRITTFDQAFLSRFSLAIAYPELDVDSRSTIWRKFFELAGYQVQESNIEGDIKILLTSDIVELARKPFNGRTIKNIVRTAQSLALSTGVPMSLREVQIVIKAQEKFLNDFSNLNG